MSFEKRISFESEFSRTIALLAIVASTLVFSACRRERTTPQVTTSSARAAPITSVKRVRYDFSAAKSKIVVTRKTADGKIEATIERFSGSIIVEDNDARRVQVRADIDASSVTTQSAEATQRLKGTDGLDVANHPSVRFVSTASSVGGEMGATNTLHGELQLRGTTHAISIPATVHMQPTHLDIDAEFSIDPRAFGVPGNPDVAARGEVTVALLIHAEASPAARQ